MNKIKETRYSKNLLKIITVKRKRQSIREDYSDLYIMNVIK